jgi:hypothetical protein
VRLLPLLALVFVVATGCYVWSVEFRIARVVGLEVETVTTKWVSGGQSREVTTTQKLGESLKSWQERHFEAVRAAQNIYPPD